MTKGSPEKPAAVWAQRQGTASPGLLRVCQKARQKMAEPFTALLHHVTPALLEASYYALKRNAAPGVDGIMWEAYGGGHLMRPKKDPAGLPGRASCERRHPGRHEV